MEMDTIKTDAPCEDCHSGELLEGDRQPIYERYNQRISELTDITCEMKMTVSYLEKELDGIIEPQSPNAECDDGESGVKSPPRPHLFERLNNLRSESLSLLGKLNNIRERV